MYGYGQSSQQPQGQQPQGQHSPPEQYAYNQQSYSSNSNDAHNHTSLPNFSSYMSSQQQHSNTNSPTIPHSASMDKVDSPHLNHKSKDEYQQQQYSYNSSIRDISSSQQIKSPNQSNSNNFNNNYRNAPSYRHLNSSPATSPTHQQLYTHNSSHVGFNSVRIN